MSKKKNVPELKSGKDEIVSKIKKMPKSVWVYIVLALIILSGGEGEEIASAEAGLLLVFGIYWLIKSNNKKKLEKELKGMNEEERKLATESVRRVLLQDITNHFSIGIGKSSAVMCQRKDGTVFFDKNYSQQFVLTDYEWGGAEFNESVVSKTKGNDKSKTKRTGRATGALLGTLIAPGVGTIVGGMVGTGNKKTKGKNESETVQTVNKKEVKTLAALKLVDKNTNEKVIIGFECDSKKDIEIRSFVFEETEDDTNVDYPVDEKTSIQLLKEYKDLLDEGIITQEEFDKKKKELLNI